MVSQLTCWAAFLFLTAVHVWANWLGVGSLQLVRLNRQRAALVCDMWWSSAQTERNLRIGPAHIATLERPWGPLWHWLRGPQLGAPLSVIVGKLDFDSAGIAIDDLRSLYRGEAYMIRLRPDGVPAVALTSDANRWASPSLCPSHTGSLVCACSAFSTQPTVHGWLTPLSCGCSKTLLKALLHCSLLSHDQRSGRVIPRSTSQSPGLSMSEKVSCKHTLDCRTSASSVQIARTGVFVLFSKRSVKCCVLISSKQLYHERRQPWVKRWRLFSQTGSLSLLPSSLLVGRK